jgi:hypothetical protein
MFFYLFMTTHLNQRKFLLAVWRKTVPLELQMKPYNNSRVARQIYVGVHI